MLIQTARLARKLQRALRLTALPDSVLAPETVPIIIVEDLSAPLGDEDRGCMGSTIVAGVLAEFSIMLLVRVGAPAEYDLIVTEAHFGGRAAQRIVLSIPTGVVVGLNPSNNKAFTDLAIPGRPTSQLATDTQVVIPARRVIASYEVLAGVTYRVPLNIRVGTIRDPNEFTSVMIHCETANTLLSAGFKWTEAAPLG